MGASTFVNSGKGETATKVFKSLVDQDRYENGHCYSGGIGMKHTFREVTLPKGANVHEFIQQLLDDDSHWVSDKDGPAGCIKVKDNEWVFFGWASS